MLTLIRVLGTLVGALVLVRGAGFLTRRFERHLIASDTAATLATAARIKRARTLGKVLLAGARIVIWAVALVMVLGELGQDVRPLLAAAGVGGIALGFGAQNLVRDVIGGFFILLEGQYDVDDIIEVAGVSGIVEEVGLRTTVLRDLNGRRHVVPNGEIKVTTNLTKDFSRYLFDLPVPYDADIDKAVDIAKDAAEQMRQEAEYGALILAPLEVLGVDNYADSFVSVKVYVETAPGKQWKVGRELRHRIKRAWEDVGISIPYPHREVLIRRVDETDPDLGPDGAGSRHTPRTSERRGER